MCTTVATSAEAFQMCTTATTTPFGVHEDIQQAQLLLALCMPGTAMPTIPTTLSLAASQNTPTNTLHVFSAGAPLLHTAACCLLTASGL
jgi:hypothetical protein